MDNKLQVNHINKIRHNNRAQNLELKAHTQDFWYQAFAEMQSGLS